MSETDTISSSRFKTSKSAFLTKYTIYTIQYATIVTEIAYLPYVVLEELSEISVF